MRLTSFDANCERQESFQICIKTSKPKVVKMVGIFHFLITCQTDNKNLASTDFGKLESAVFFLPENNSR